MTDKPIPPRTVFITGAASGIGRATALLFAQDGANVAVADRDAAGAEGVVGEIEAAGGVGVAISLDVTLEEQWQEAIGAVMERWGRLDVLVNNAGIAAGNPLTAMPFAEWRRVMAVNLDGTFLGTQCGVEAMRRGGNGKQGGAIINVASASGIKAAPGASAYSTSKAAVRMFSRTIALECAAAGDGIRVNTVCPGGVRTPMWGDAEEADFEALAAEVPLRRFATPEEIARAIFYLASEDAAFVTGTDLVIDGGYSS